MHVKMTNLCMVCHGDQVLVQNRTKNDWPGITFPGGKVEPNESVYESAIREVKEETGLTISQLQLCGIIYYELTNKEERWVMFLYRSDTFTGTLQTIPGEDEAFWMPYEDLHKRELSLDLDKYLKVFEDENISEAHAYWHGTHASDFTFYGKEEV